MIQVREFTNGADVLAHAAEIRRKFYGPRQVAPTRVLPAPEMVAVETNLSAQTRQDCETFPAEADSLEAASATGEVGPVRDIIDLSSSGLDHVPSAFRLHVRANRIVQTVAAEHGVTFTDIIGPRRHRGLIEARFDAISRVYVALPQWTMHRLGVYFGNRDHTTILHAVRKTGVWRGGQ